MFVAGPEDLADHQEFLELDTRCQTIIDIHCQVKMNLPQPCGDWAELNHGAIFRADLHSIAPFALPFNIADVAVHEFLRFWSQERRDARDCAKNSSIFLASERSPKRDIVMGWRGRYNIFVDSEEFRHTTEL